jgi:CheY-like chemotaxis protein
MPRMNGFEFLEEYNKLDEKMKARALVILTTSMNPEDVVRAKELGATGFENKPLTPKMVEDIVNKCF